MNVNSVFFYAISELVFVVQRDHPHYSFAIVICFHQKFNLFQYLYLFQYFFLLD